MASSSSFRRAPLTVTAYKQLLDSPSIIAETRKRLVEEEVLAANAPCGAVGIFAPAYSSRS